MVISYFELEYFTNICIHKIKYNNFFNSNHFLYCYHIIILTIKQFISYY